MVTQGKGNDNDDAGDLSTKTKHSRFHDDHHNDIDGNTDELYTNAFPFHNFEVIQNYDNEFAQNIQGVSSF